VAPAVAEQGAAQMIERIALDGWRAPTGESGDAVIVPGSGPNTATAGIRVERR